MFIGSSHRFIKTCGDLLAHCLHVSRTAVSLALTSLGVWHVTGNMMRCRYVLCFMYFFYWFLHCSSILDCKGYMHLDFWVCWRLSRFIKIENIDIDKKLKPFSRMKIDAFIFQIEDWNISPNWRLLLHFSRLKIDTFFFSRLKIEAFL